MKQSKSAVELIDLSFLSAEEEAAIRQVLLRDEDLKRLESGRVSDIFQQLKTLTGEWFEELRSQRYGHQIEVTAVVRSSMRWKNAAAHKPNPFLNDVLDENSEHEKEEHIPANPTVNPRLLHPSLSKETSINEKVGENSTTPTVSERKEKRQSETGVPNGTDARLNSTKTHHRELSGDQTTPTLPFSTEEQDGKPESSSTRQATDPDRKRKVSLPPALQRDQSFEENWVKIFLEPNRVRTEFDVNSGTGPGEIKSDSVNTSEDQSQDISGHLKTSYSFNVTEFYNQPKSSFDFSNDGPGKTRLSDNRDSREVNDSPKFVLNLSQQCSPELTPEKFHGETLGTIGFTNDSDGRKEAITHIIKDEPSWGMVQSEGSNPKIGLRSETDLNGKAEGSSGEEEINNYWLVEDVSQNPKQMNSPEHFCHLDHTKDNPTEDEKKKQNENQLLLKESADREIVEDLDVKPSDKSMKGDVNSLKNKDQSSMDEPFAEISQDYYSMTDDGKLVHIGEVKNEKSPVKAIEPAHPGGDVARLGQSSLEINDEENDSDKGQRTESEILANVLARAHGTKPPAEQRIAQEPKLETKEDLVPSIAVMQAESTYPEEMKGKKHGPLVLEALLDSSCSKNPIKPDTWEDEELDSDDDVSQSFALSLNDRTGSLLSIYSDAGDFGGVEVQGSVEFGVMYSPVGELTIMIERCEDLAVANQRKQRTDPYVKTYLYHDKSRRSKRKTSIKKKTLNPVFVESLRYKVKREELPEKILNLSVWHNDSRGRNVFLGQTSEKQESHESNGCLSISLKYVPPASTGGSKNSSGEIHVWLHEAKELRRVKPQGVDSFVKW
ncbi:hypothetical protein DNTS_004492 [Danionella cerebrum]|uniref:C2 domain-containing protein n=1 Tax=Danionella cerebrum TaxID=2873325 RepID=A0A553P986_9TELE|nr:hypothetical protein DNTS_004492 [Danionella translucida]